VSDPAVHRTAALPAADDAGAVRWLDPEEREAWLNLLRMVAKLPAALDAQLERDAGLTLFEYTILAMLSEQSGYTLRMSRLATVTNASPSRLSHAARHLESRGYLERGADPEDGRCIRATLTDAGLALVVRAAPGHVATARDLVVDRVDVPQLRALRLAAERILARIDPDGSSHPDRAAPRATTGGPTQSHASGTLNERTPMTIDVHDSPGTQRYEISEDGTVVGFLTYRQGRGLVDLVHAEVDPDHSGRGLAGQLVAFALDDVRRRQLGVLPHCPYVQRYIDGHQDDYLDLVPADRRPEFGWS